MPERSPTTDTKVPKGGYLYIRIGFAGLKAANAIANGLRVDALIVQKKLFVLDLSREVRR